MGFGKWLKPFGVIDELTGKNDSLKQNQNAIESSERISGISNQTTRDMYQTGRQDQLPFMTPSLSALPMYQSAILGGPVEYQDPRYQRMTSFDPDYASAMKQFQSQQQPAPQGSGLWGGIGKQIAGMQQPSGGNIQLYRAPDGSYTDKPPMLSAEYKPQETEAFKWQSQQGNKQMERSLRSLGRSNSTYGMQRRDEFNQNLNANEYEKGINRLATLAGFGQGIASNVAGQGNSAAGQIANTSGNTANSLNNLYQQRGGIFSDFSPLSSITNGVKIIGALK